MKKNYKKANKKRNPRRLHKKRKAMRFEEQRSDKKRKLDFEQPEFVNQSIESVDDVLKWIRNIGYGKYVTILGKQFKEDNVTGTALKLMNMSDLKSYGIDDFVDRKMILKAIGKLA